MFGFWTLEHSEHWEHWGHGQPYAFVLHPMYQVLSMYDVPFAIQHSMCHIYHLSLYIWMLSICLFLLLRNLAQNEFNRMWFNWFSSFVWDQFQIISWFIVIISCFRYFVIYLHWKWFYFDVSIVKIVGSCLM